MFSKETTDALAIELAFTYYRVRVKGASDSVLEEIRGLAVRVIGGAEFNAALEVVPKFFEEAP